MDHILSYNAINEAAASLPKIPTFLKNAGAKPEHVQYGGPRKPNQPANAWGLEVKNPSKADVSWKIDFFPDGSFSTAISPEDGGQMPYRSGGSWKEDGASSFKIGKTTLKGVSMKFNTLMVPTTYM
jgi:hypothetical protein